MSDQDDSQKTEEATPKKLQDAVNKGNVVTSQEFKTWMLLFAVTAAVMSGGRWFSQKILVLLNGYMHRIADIRADTTGYLGPLSALVVDVMLIMLVPFSIFIVFGVLANTLQHPTVLSFEKVKPNLSKINPINGMKKFVSTQIWVTFGQNLIKLTFLVGVVSLIVWPERARLDTLMTLDMFSILVAMEEMAIKLLIGVLIFMTIVAIIDYSYQNWKYHKDLKMTKQEVKDERKQADGDPLVKRKIRQIRMERAQMRMMANVPRADVVITNPTHYAIALEYKHGTMDVPRLLAKGVDEVAARIRETAEEHGIPLVENPPLARALYASVDIDEEVPPEHYKTVAEVIGYVMKLRRAGLVKGKPSA